MDVKKIVKLLLQLILTTGLVAFYFYIVYILEYWTQLGAVDNIAGAAPLILLTGIAVFLITLIWKRHKNAETSTIILSIMSIIWALLFIPALTGNWYPLAKMPAPDLTSPDLTVYKPFTDNTKAAKLPGAASLTIFEDMPKLDGATALYPVYAAFVNAVYTEDNYVPDMALCTNTANAYQRIIMGDCDIIFVAGASEKQKQAAAAAGSELVFTPIGREAFVFLVGKNNPIEELSYQQLKNIYSGKTAYWRTFGWNDGGKIIVFQRPEGSGSQTGLQNIMRGLPIQKPQPLPDDSLIGTGGMLKQVSVEWQGVQPAIGYSYRYYATTMYPNPDAKLLAIDGVYPSNETIADGRYPFTNKFYAVTNGEPMGNVKKLIDWILSDEGQYLIEQTGYVPLNNTLETSAPIPVNIPFQPTNVEGLHIINLLDGINEEGVKFYFDMKEIDDILIKDTWDYSIMDDDVILRPDFPLLDIYYGRKDTGAIVLKFMQGGNQHYMSTSIGGSNSEFYVETFAVGRGTTPYLHVEIYKNGKLIKSVPATRLYLGGLEDTFFPIDIVREEDVENAADIVAKYTQKTQGKFKISCTLLDEDIIDNDYWYATNEAVEYELNRIYGLDVRAVEVSVNSLTSEPYRHARCSVEISCDKDFYNELDRELLTGSLLLHDIEIGEYIEPMYSEMFYVKNNRNGGNLH